MMKKAVFGLTIVVIVIVAGCATGSGVRSASDKSEDFQIDVNNGAVTITDYMGSAKNVTIPDRIGGLPVAAIGRGAFIAYQLSSITIPGSVTAIGEYAFARNLLTSITIPGSVTTIGTGAFQENQLSSITISGSVTVIGEMAFFRNKLKSVVIPGSVTIIGAGAFWDNQLTIVTIPASVDVAGYPFDENLTQVYTSGGSRAGTYTSGDGGKTWTRQ